MNKYFFTATVFMALSSVAFASIKEWPVAGGGNGHRYEAVSVPEGITRADAKKRATDSGGYLATITSKEENDFVFNLVNDPALWNIGGISYGPWIGGELTGVDTWMWAPGEPMIYKNWHEGEPNNFWGNEYYVHYFNLGSVPAPFWNDQPDVSNGTNRPPVAYVVEYNAD
jgi:hypothetical protein